MVECIKMLVLRSKEIQIRNLIRMIFFAINSLQCFKVHIRSLLLKLTMNLICDITISDCVLSLTVISTLPIELKKNVFKNLHRKYQDLF